MSGSDPAVRAAYEEWHRRLTLDPAADTPWFQLVRRHLDPRRDLAGRSVLDVGCGRGDLTCWLARQPVRPRTLTAADFALSAVAQGARFAAGHGLGGVRWRVADLQALPFPADAFDTVFSCETVEHVADPGRAVRELARVLVPGGRLYLTTPSYLNLAGLYRVYLRLWGRRFQEAGQPLNHPLLLPWTRALVRRAGLVVEVVDSVLHPLPWPGRTDAQIPFPRFLHPLTRWLGVQSLIRAAKPR